MIGKRVISDGGSLYVDTSGGAGLQHAESPVHNAVVVRARTQSGIGRAERKSIWKNIRDHDVAGRLGSMINNVHGESQVAAERNCAWRREC